MYEVYKKAHPHTDLEKSNQPFDNSPAEKIAFMTVHRRKKGSKGMIYSYTIIPNIYEPCHEKTEVFA